MSVLRDESFYYQYEYNGGTIEMPKEVFWELYNDSKEEIERLNNIINNVYNYLDAKKYVPEWWDTDFMICMDMLRGGTGNLIDIIKGEDK